MMLQPLVFLGAGLLDEALGDPESWPHPVRAFGWVIAKVDAARNRIGSPATLRFLGALLALGLPLAAAGFAWAWVRLCGPWGWAAQVLLGAWMLAGRSLRTAVKPVAAALAAGDLGSARLRVAMVVGRDTGRLDEREVARAGLETLAESLCDGVGAPLFWFALGGLPGLWAFKAVSTLDSMVGHREAPWTHFGWASAKLDDLMNWLPARITALLIALCGHSWPALRLAWRDGGKTSSPNAGTVEAAFAGALGLQLGGTNFYDGVAKAGPVLGDPGAALDARALGRGLGLAARVNGAAILLGTLALGCLHG